MKNLFLRNRLFWSLGVLSLLSALSFALPLLFPWVLALLLFLAVAFATDCALLFRRSVSVACRRKLPKVFGLGDENKVSLEISHSGSLRLFCTLIEELPEQLQIRDFEKKIELLPGTVQQLSYSLRPIERGLYVFGKTNLFVSTRLGLAERRITVRSDAESVPVYPSILQMKQLEIKAIQQISTQHGIKKMRRLGHSYAFEQIKDYVPGDDYRSINWKASSRKGEWMVNQYEDERAQQVYFILDKSRVMRSPFNGMSLLDHAINATLALSNVALQKYDKAGLITFSDKLGGVVKADSKPMQRNAFLHQLYREAPRQTEANFDLLYFAVRKLIGTRSLLLLFSNFESKYALERALPALRKIARFHLLVVVFFENTEVAHFAAQSPQSVEDIYLQTAAKKYLHDKQQIAQILRQYGIQTVYTKPEELSVNTLNKYLELKARGMI
jgi:uncharacterized protein (DUF58 family)